MAKQRTTRKHRTRGSTTGYYIYRAWKIDSKTREKMWAKDHGLKAWKIWVPFDGQHPDRANQ